MHPLEEQKFKLGSNNSSPSAKSFQWFHNIIFEISDILLRSPIADKPKLKYHPHLNTHEIFNSIAYYNFEKGLSNEEGCRQQICKSFNLSDDEVQALMRSALPTAPVPEMLNLVKSLQKDHKVYGVDNLPRSVFQLLRTDFKFLDSLENVFVSSQLGERMPHLGFFDAISDIESLKVGRTLFVSSNLDRVVAARSLGFYAIVSTNIHETVTRVQAMCNDPIPDAQQYLRANACQMDLETSTGQLVKDAFAQFLILDATRDESLVEYDDTQTEYTWTYGNMPNLFTYPPDIDTNSIGMTAIEATTPEVRNKMMDKMLHYRDSRGVLQTYLVDDRTRVCATAALNALTMFNKFGRGHQVKETENWIYRILETRAFRDGTRYYPTPDFFLYFCSRLLVHAPHLRKRFEPMLRECVLERTEAPGDALSLACRIIASARCRINCRVDFERMLTMQEEDGGFGAGLCYGFARGGLDCYHRGLTAALAVLAIKEWDHLRYVEEQESVDVASGIDTIQGYNMSARKSVFTVLYRISRSFMVRGRMGLRPRT